MNNEELLAAFLVSSLRSEFEQDTYGSNVMFFPDNTSVRNAKFFLWLFTRLGVKEKALLEAEKYQTLHLLSRKK